VKIASAALILVSALSAGIFYLMPVRFLNPRRSIAVLPLVDESKDMEWTPILRQPVKP
jgi:hypothetical protein